MALHCCTNSVLNCKALEVSAYMLSIQASASQFTGFIVLDCAPVQAECVALFSASSTENRLKHFDGFAGAAFFASICGRFVLEYVIWKDPAALAAAREDPTFSEHMKVVEHHCSLRYVSFSSISNSAGIDAIRFKRGDRFFMRLHPAAESVSGTRDLLGSIPELARANSLFQMAEDGTSFVLLSRDAIDTSGAAALRTIFGDSAFHHEFAVVESVAPPSVREKSAALYNLALVLGESPGPHHLQ
jgi:hypothetical protein